MDQINHKWRQIKNLWGKFRRERRQW